MNINDYKKVTDRLTPDERCRKEVLDMSKRENKIKLNTNEYTEDVTGVEVRSGGNLMRCLSAAAAFVLIAGGVGATGVLLHRNSKNAQQLTSVVEESTTAENATEIASELTSEGKVSDFEAVAKELTDGYLDRIEVLSDAKISFDLNDKISFNLVQDQEEGEFDPIELKMDYYKVTDEHFNSCQDLFDYYNEVFVPIGNSSDKYSPFSNAITADDCNIKSWLGGDVSRFEDGSDVKLLVSDVQYDEAVKNEGMYISNYVDYNGQLYVSGIAADPIDEHYNTEPVVIESSEDRMIVSRYLCRNLEPDTDLNEQYGIQLKFTIVSENGEWKIQSIERGLYPEASVYSAVVSYFYDKPEYYDIELAEVYGKYGDYVVHALDPLEILELDEENKTAKVHAVLRNTNNVDAVEIDADIDLTEEKVINAEVKRLVEYDDSLKRSDVIWMEEHPEEW